MLLASKGSRSSTDLSVAMLKHIPEIKSLSYMPDGLKLVYHLILHLGRRSFKLSSVRSSSDLINRPSDEPADSLLLDILVRLKEKDEVFDVREEFKKLYSERFHFVEHDIHTYFPRSYNLMCSLKYGPDYARVFHDDIEKGISKVNEACEVEIQPLLQRSRDAKPVYRFK